MGLGLVVDELDVLDSTFFELLLKIATAVLILAKGIDLAFEAFERNVVKTRDFCADVSSVVRPGNIATHLRVLGFVYVV